MHFNIELCLTRHQHTAGKDGFMYIYACPSEEERRRVANETLEDVNVYFPARLTLCYSFVDNVYIGGDDLTVTHTGINIVQSTDYYPYGLVLRESKDEEYRFGYQGQFAEMDSTTGWNHFELRQYDSRIGRWLVVDPARQFSSPYVGMGNNPVSGVDPDGGFKWEWMANFKAWLMPNETNPIVFYHATEKEYVVMYTPGNGMTDYFTKGGPGLGADSFTFDGVATFGITGTGSAGLAGASFEAGLAIELKEEYLGYLRVAPYVTVEHAIGGDYSLGGVANYHKPNKGTMDMSAIRGWSETWNGGVGGPIGIDFTYGGNSLNPGLGLKDYSDQHLSYHTYGVGLSVGSPIGITRNKGYTFVFD